MLFTRWTTEYADSEDRIRIVGESADLTVTTVWLSRRLLERLLPLLTQWLEGQVLGAAHADMLLNWEQQAANAELQPQAPVLIKASSVSWVTTAIDIQREPSQLTIVFRADDGRKAGLAMPARALRQWIGILHGQSEKAEWRLPVWPTWVAGESVAHAGPQPQLH